LRTALLCAVALTACSGDRSDPLVGRWVPDHGRGSAVTALTAEARAQAVAHEALVGEQSLEFDGDGTLIHVAGPLTRRAKWRITVPEPLTIETRSELGDGERRDTYLILFEGPSVLVTEEPDGYRTYYKRAG